MVTLYLIAVLAVIVPVVGGPLLAYGPVRRVLRSAAADRIRAATSGLVAALGRPGAAVVVVLAWSAAVVAVFWPIGELAHALEHAVDWPALRWVGPRRSPGFEDFNWLYTALGDRYPLKWVTVVAALVFAVLWRRRFWIPLVVFPAQFVLEQYVQAIIATMVGRGHPPTGLGTYPSGGIARIVMVFGTLALFVALTWRFKTKIQVAMGTGVLLLATYEGYSRIYVQKHWLTDVVSGLLFGPALFAGFALGVCVLAGVVGRAPARTPAAVS